MGARLLNDNEDVIRLRSAESFLLNYPNNNSILVDPEKQDPRDSATLHARFNDLSGDGIKIISYAKKSNSEVVPAQECQFKVYSIDTNTWARTLEHTETITTPESDYSFELDLTEAQLSTEVIGERVFFIQAIINRFSKFVREEKYFNNIGIFDWTLRLKNKINILDVQLKTKD